jgi:hypothetical protein
MLRLALVPDRPVTEVAHHSLGRRLHMCPEPNFDGSLPLHVAVAVEASVRLDLVRLVVDIAPRGPLLKADYRGSIPLHLALSRSAPDLELVRLILDRHPSSPFLAAGDCGSIDPVARRAVH